VFWGADVFFEVGDEFSIVGDVYRSFNVIHLITFCGEGIDEIYFFAAVELCFQNFGFNVSCHGA